MAQKGLCGNRNGFAIGERIGGGVGKIAKKDIDGGLIGGAALKAADFAGIIAAAANA